MLCTLWGSICSLCAENKLDETQPTTQMRSHIVTGNSHTEKVKGFFYDVIQNHMGATKKSNLEKVYLL